MVFGGVAGEDFAGRLVMAGLMRLESVEFAMISGGDVEDGEREGLWHGDKMPYEFNCRILRLHINENI